MKPLGGSSPADKARITAHEAPAPQAAPRTGLFNGLQFREPPPKNATPTMPLSMQTSLKVRPAPQAPQAPAPAMPESAGAAAQRSTAREAPQHDADAGALGDSGAAAPPRYVSAVAARQGRGDDDGQHDEDGGGGQGGGSRHPQQGHPPRPDHAPDASAARAKADGRPDAGAASRSRAAGRPAPGPGAGTPARVPLFAAQRPVMEFMATQLALLSENVPGSQTLWGTDPASRRAGERERALASVLLWNAERVDSIDAGATPSQVSRAALHAYLGSDPRPGVLWNLSAVQDLLLTLRPGRPESADGDLTDKQRVHNALLPLILLHANRPRTSAARETTRARIQFVESSTRQLAKPHEGEET
ncbi:MAG TPA: hypothetical protein VFR90_10770 [Methylibium sp.]|uniref:hypothetical protein n=1 Tax=Methylibium sp. TaxID=2067992 RepID=UPI002DB6D8A3|nr:hypothetical protein [Methylibium sp.]HEU4459596.1 hypothetical protein [Methylibium sp.]